MDELHAAQTVLDAVIKKASGDNAKRLIHVYIVIGEISGCTAESAQDRWRQISKGTLAERAILHFRDIPAEVQCMSCFRKYHPEHGEFHCPTCGGVGVKILAGEEFYLEKLDME